MEPGDRCARAVAHDERVARQIDGERIAVRVEHAERGFTRSQVPLDVEHRRVVEVEHGVALVEMAERVPGNEGASQALALSLAELLRQHGRLQGAARLDEHVWAPGRQLGEIGGPSAHERLCRLGQVRLDRRHGVEPLEAPLTPLRALRVLRATRRTDHSGFIGA